MSYMKNVYDQISEFLDNKLGREATAEEIQKFMNDLEDAAYDNQVSSMRGK